MSFIPFPIGTVRGPYTCGWKDRHDGGIQFLVQGRNGWVPFIRSRKDYLECKKEAEKYAAKVLTGED
jgi:hypothetical protein